MKRVFFIASFFLLLPFFSQARTPDQISDWYIKNFDSQITVNKDSSLLIKEKITADCGNLPGKHGIFRTLPTVLKTPDKTISMPVGLISITDFSGRKVNYTEQNDYTNNTLTWKIGDPDKTVTGENNYILTYQVKNTINFNNPSFDELYWNLNGNFWDIEIDNFSGQLVFPQGINQEDIQISYYAGALNEKGNELASYKWIGDNVLEFVSKGTLYPGEGITASVSFPKNIFVPYQPTLYERYGIFFWAIIPLLALIGCFMVWNRYGKDPRVDKTVIPEFEIPENLSPIELGMLMTNGKLKNEFISASLVNLAVKKIIQIEEVEGAGIFGSGKDYRLKVIGKEKFSALGPVESVIVTKMFSGKDELLLSSLKNKFYQNLKDIRDSGIDALNSRGFIRRTGLTLQVVLFVVGFGAFFLAFFLSGAFPESLPSIIATAMIIMLFAAFMPQRTPLGAETNWRIKGFKWYMETAEKYRQQFNEKENIFEKFLPYAIVFGMTKLWISKMKEIYGEEYFNSYHPAWFVGGSLASFDADSFASHVESISSSIASNVSSGSGAGGGGFSGGGGGGGGGGGW